MRLHLTADIDVLLQLTNSELGKMFNNSGSDVRDELEERKAKGELKIGSKGCEGFDPVTGCPGHDKKQTTVKNTVQDKVEAYIESCNYTHTYGDVVFYYNEYYKRGERVSHTMKDVIVNSLIPAYAVENK